MGINDYYQNLYTLQDKVLKALFSLDLNFYLTGGTCLHRFYIEKRYSDDLDFFCNDNELFRDYIREVKLVLNNQFEKNDLLIDTRDFVRFKIDEFLKIDFVNDRVYRLGRSEKTENGILIDNIDNILSNKITAIIGRDEPKDIYDICTIGFYKKIDWTLIIESSLKKCFFEKDTLIDRLQTFPIHLLDSLSTIEPLNSSEIQKQIYKIIDQISLYG